MKIAIASHDFFPDSSPFPWDEKQSPRGTQATNEPKMALEDPPRAFVQWDETKDNIQRES